MSLIKNNAYKNLIAEISTHYETARQQLVRAYWNIGKLICEDIQKNSGRAEYGKYLIQQLSLDLNNKYGQGFSCSRLQRMKQFYREYPIVATSQQLTWSKYVELLSVEDIKERAKIEKKVIKGNLPVRKVRELVKEINSKQNFAAFESMTKSLSNNSEIPQLKPSLGKLYVYKLLDPKKIEYPKGEVIIDLGFKVYQNVFSKIKYEKNKFIQSVKVSDGFVLKANPELTKADCFTYSAIVDHVVDGDTFVVFVNLGFRAKFKVIIRLNGINAPEKSTEEGQKIKLFLEKKFKKGKSVVIKTSAIDMYGRYLADFFYSEDDVDLGKSIKCAKFLNQELLDLGLVEVY